MPERIPREIWVLVAAAFCVALGYGIIAPILPQYAQSFGVSIGAASSIVSAFALMRLVFAPPGGALVNRFGERNVYISGLVIVAASTAACAVAQTFEQLLIVRALGGVGSTMFTISAMGLIVRVAPTPIRGRVSALYGTAFLSGTIAGPLLGTALSFLGYRTPFLIYAVALLIAAAVVAVNLSGVRGGPAGRAADAAGRAAADAAGGAGDGAGRAADAAGRAAGDAGEPTVHAGEPAAHSGGPTASDPAGEARPTLSLAEALRLPAYRALLAAQFANGWTNFGVRISLLPLLAAAVPTLGAPLAGLGLTAYAVGNFLVLQLSGRLVDTRGRRGPIVAGLVLGGAVALPFGWVTQPVPFLALSAAAGVAASLVQPGQQAAFADILGRDRAGGQALAAFSMTSDLGGFLGPVLTGFAADRFGFGGAYAFAGALMLASALPWLFAKDTLTGRPAA